VTTAAAPERPPVAGFVEARTPTRILGWAWDPAAPAARLAVELRAGNAVVAAGRADQSREDLARSGVGDGAHAFALELPEAWHGRADALAVHARAEDGTDTPLAEPPAADPAAALLRVQRGLEQLVASQRAVLRAVREQPAPPSDPDLPARLLATQSRIEEQLGTLEVFVSRLDTRLAALAADAAPP
jgi:hypothetical protein